MNNEIHMSSRLSCTQDTRSKSCLLFLPFYFLPQFSEHQVDALSLDVNKPLSMADGKRSRRNILASSAPHPLFLSPSFLPLLARRVLDSKQLSSLAPIVSYPILQSPRLSFFHRPRSHLIATGLVWVAAAQHSPKPLRNLLSPRLVGAAKRSR